MPQPATPLPLGEHARRHGVTPAAISAALSRARQRHQNDPTAPAPPEPDHTDPATGREYWTPARFDRWWVGRPTGRPTGLTPAKRRHLNRLLADPTLSQQQRAQRLGTSTSTLRRWTNSIQSTPTTPQES